MAKDKMDISIIVPLYKGQKYVLSIQKMVAQNVVFANERGKKLEVELIFVNDYPDEAIVVNTEVQRYKVFVIANNDNCGIHQTRVNGLKRSRGEYVLFLDQDDEITPNCLFSQYSVIGDKDMVVGNGYRGINGDYRKIYRSVKKQQLVCREMIFLKAANQIVSPGHCLIRRSAIHPAWCNNIMKENGGDDLFLWLLMFENDKKFCINHECVYRHVDTGVNFSSNLLAMYRSSDNLIKIAEETGALKQNTINIYRRRINYLKAIYETSGILRIVLTIKNLDILIAKIYAYYR